MQGWVHDNHRLKPCMTPDILLPLMVMASAVTHALVNALMKSHGDRIALRSAISAVEAIGGAIAAFFVPLPEGGVWLVLILSAFIHVAYQIILMAAYTHADFSLAYPVARGTAPLLTALGAMILFGEHVPIEVMAGVFLISAALIAFALEPQRQTVLHRKGVLLAAATGVAITAYTLVDVWGVRLAADPMSFIVWLYIACCFLLNSGMLLTGGRASALRIARAWRPGIVGGILSLISYTLALLAFDMGATAEVAALRETSVLFGVMLGVFLFGERLGLRRAVSALVIASGAILIAVH